ncbi:hybrid sensor histidine kinase/response regulator [Brevundimonas sp.]|uniref:hybrid sensor histidine kinase/response regulator n=1 Tax=Brevundimonas sp. TaxID=1871086 RepID=UPI002D25B7BF|nr:ATP-binding protein [Brevundimonas sp.]HYC75904.1 ATP-binding protein [Brevundimonas sp.]
MKGRWRLFRHDAGRVAGPPALAYVVLYGAALAVGYWTMARFGTATVWLANGVVTAALLQLHRRPALAVLAACAALDILINNLRGASAFYVAANVVLNLGMAVGAAVLARRVCGAALDLRRPGRLARFALLAVVPATVLAASSSMAVLALMGPPKSWAMWLFEFENYVAIEVLGLLLVTPILLLLARRHRFAGATRASSAGGLGLIALMLVVTGLVFWQDHASLMFLVFLPMTLIGLRLSPTWSAAALIGLAILSGAATLMGHGPVHLTRLADLPGLEGVAPMMRNLGVYNLFLLAIVITILPISTVMTERRRLEARLRARTAAAQEARRVAENAAAARSRFLAMMSHEMRTPLNGVAGFADLLATRSDLDAEAVRQARQIRESSDGLLMLVEDILDFARGDDTVTPERLDLAAVAREAAAPSRAEAESRGLGLTIDDRLPARSRFNGDRRALRQALHPLIANAVKFTAEGEVSIRLDWVGEGVAIRVSDTGCGIAPDHHAELFEAFSQADASTSRLHEGVGLGLALAARHVRRLGGRIEVESRAGEGSTFTLHLPLTRVPDAPAEAAAAVVDPDAATAPTADVATGEPSRPPRVLVVDDHPVNREVARIMVQAFGCEVVEACDGHEAVHAAGAHTLDLVLMDVRMPRMDGLEATRRIRALPDDRGIVPVVAMTADAMPEDVVRCLAAGMNAHLPKPVSQAALFAIVSRALAGDLPAVAARVEPAAA